VLGRDEDNSVHELLEAHGYDVHLVEGNDPMTMHKAFAETLDTCYVKIHAYQEDARAHAFTQAPRWPAIILCTPKGGRRSAIEGTFRAH